MRAKTINEVQNFHRSGNPKAAIDIGGIMPGKVRHEIKQKAEKEWKEFILGLEGKTITGQFNKIWNKGDKTLEPGEGWGEYTITIEKILNKEIDLDIQGIEVLYNMSAYIIPLGEKFYIKNES